jgi:hypothetical protein
VQRTHERPPRPGGFFAVGLPVAHASTDGTNTVNSSARRRTPPGSSRTLAARPSASSSERTLSPSNAASHFQGASGVAPQRAHPESGRSVAAMWVAPSAGV